MSTNNTGEYCSHRNHGRRNCTPGNLVHFTIVRFGRTREPGSQPHAQNISRWLCPYHAEVHGRSHTR